MFKHFLTSSAPLEELMEALEDENEDTIEALLMEVEDEIMKLNEKEFHEE
jgi:hypothetical protein